MNAVSASQDFDARLILKFVGNHRRLRADTAMRICFVFLLGLLISGCSTYGPSPESPEFHDAVQSVVRPEEIVHARSGAWYPNQFGFNQSPFARTPLGVPGVFVMTDKDIFFLTYHTDSSKFVTASKLGIEEINQAVTDTFGRAMRLVLVSDKGINSFELYQIDSIFLDRSLMTEVVKQILEKRQPAQSGIK